MRQSGTVPPVDPEALEHEPWEHLQDLIAAGAAEEIPSFLTALPPGDTARALSRLSETALTALLALLRPEDAADVLEALPESRAVDQLAELPAERAAAIVDALPSAEQADLLGKLDAPEAEAILGALRPQRATTVRRLLAYEPETAGGVMIAEYLAHPATATVADLLADLRAHADRYHGYEIQYVYVTGHDRLVGVLRLRDLLLAPADQPLAALMLPDPLRVRDTTPLEDLKRFFDQHAFFGAPVVDADDRLVGVVRRAAVEEGLRERATRTFLAVSGLVGEEELRSMSLATRSRKRLSWLSINIVLNLIAASVIAFHQDTLSAVIALAVFLPMISDMSGASGNQAVAVSIRELTLGLLRPYEFVRVAVKEGALGVVNGLVLGTLLGTLAFVWKGNVYLGLVVGSALALNTIIAVLMGGSIPLALKAMRLDPALASGPILTTITDLCGFFMVLTFASTILTRLAG